MHIRNVHRAYFLLDHRFYNVSRGEDHTESNDMLRIRGDDAWVGRKVCKDFLVDNGKGPAIKKPFYGKVVAVDEDEEHPGHRLFNVLYTDDQDEWLPVEQLLDILLPEDAQVR